MPNSPFPDEERYVNLLRRWVRMRLSGPHSDPRSDGPTQDSVERLVRDATHDTLTNLAESEIEREGTLLVRLRDAVRARLGSMNHASDILEVTMGAETAEAYERCLARLQPLEREAVVSVLEFQRSFEQLAGELNMPSAESARETYKHAVVRLAEEMGHGR